MKLSEKKNDFKITCTVSLKINNWSIQLNLYTKLLELSFLMSFKISLNFESNYLDKKYTKFTLFVITLTGIIKIVHLF